MLPQMQFPILCLVTDLTVVRGGENRLVDVVSVAVEGGVNMVQIRAPDADASCFISLADAVVDSVGDRCVTIMNPSKRTISDVRGCDGIQLSESADSTVSEVRARMGKCKLVGRSVHSVRSAQKAVDEGADFIVLGTIFPTASHPDADTHGVSIIRETMMRVDVPIVAIGGITASNAGKVIHSGASGIAVVRAILADSDPRSATSRLWEKVNEAYASSRS